MWQQRQPCTVGRSMWSLWVDAMPSTCSAQGGPTIIVNASCLRSHVGRHGQQRHKSSLAQVAEDAARRNYWKCKLGPGSKLPPGGHVWFVRRRPTKKQKKKRDKQDPELQRVLKEVENTVNDRLQFEAWKSSIESQHN